MLIIDPMIDVVDVNVEPQLDLVEPNVPLPARVELPDDFVVPR